MYAIRSYYDSIGSFIDTSSFNYFGGYMPVEKLFSIEPNEGMMLNIEGTNGSIIIKKHDADKIVIKAIARSPREDIEDVLQFINEAPDSVSVILKEKRSMSVSYEIYVPQISLGKIRICTSNGKIYGEDICCSEFIADTINSPIDLMKITSKKINTRTKNARIKLGYCTSNEFDILSSNSIVELSHVYAKEIKAKSTNGRIFAENIHTVDGNDYVSINMETTNGNIKLAMNAPENTGYHIKSYNFV